MYDVLIIGAGVTGAMCARKLSTKKLKVCIVDKENDVAMGASRANSGIVHAGFDAKEDSLKAKFNVQGSEMMEQVAKDLGVKYKRNGAMVIGFNDEDKKTIENLYNRGNANGVKKLKILNKEEAIKLEKNLSEEITCALYAPTSAIICPYELTIAAIGNAMDNGVELKLNFEVKNIKNENNCYIVKSKDEEIKARYIINCAGIYSDDISKLAGDSSFKIHGRKGEYILLDKECGDLVNATIFRTPTKLGKGILVTPTVDGNLLIGPTAEDINDKTETTNSLEGIDAITKLAKENVRNIQFEKIITSFAGLRAVGDTGDFIINCKNNFVNVSAIESPGLTSAPAIAEYVIELLKQNGLKIEDKETYVKTREAYHRFQELNEEEKNALIKKDSRYGRVICRCEGITEGEIVYAIKTNPKATDLDGVKRRTRSGMGRCQGSFCSPYVVEILSRELNINYEDVTKFGRKSYIIYKKTKGGKKYEGN